MKKQFTHGITLQPGESAEVPVDLNLPPDLLELISRGEVEMEIRQGEPFNIGCCRGHYAADVLVLIDGRLYQKLTITWREAPRRWWHVLRDFLRRK